MNEPEHLSDQKLLAYGLGWVDDSISSVVDHLEHCDDCKRRVVEMAGDRFIDHLRQAALQQTNRSAEKSHES